jgi:Protein of unknown function (DUF2948)
MERPRPLKLRARDLDDMAVIAAMLQDAVVRPAEMTYLERDKRFVMVLSRFRWEDPEPRAVAVADTARNARVPHAGSQEDGQPDEDEGDARFEDAGPRPLYERVNAGLCFEKVRRVRTQKLDLKDKDQVLSLLTVEVRPGALTLVFSGGGLVRLEVGAIACVLEDLGEPWPTPWLPLHESSDGEAGQADVREPETGE